MLAIYSPHFKNPDFIEKSRKLKYKFFRQNMLFKTRGLMENDRV
jgi:hypothetical protein